LKTIYKEVTIALAFSVVYSNVRKKISPYCAEGKIVYPRMCSEFHMWQGIITLQGDSIALQTELFYLLGKGEFHTVFTPEDG